MKTRGAQTQQTAGIMLVQCLVYLAVFAVLTSVALAAFYLCWNQSRAVVSTSDDISAALRAGERWRADVRQASAPVVFETLPEGQLARMKGPEQEVLYRFQSGELRREIAGKPGSALLLSRVRTSQMSAEQRGDARECRWELQLTERYPETQLPLLFTFEAAQTKP